MNIDIRKPNITASTAEGQLTQVKSYLAQLCEQLNWALSNISGGGQQGVVLVDKSNNVSVATDDETRAATFNSIKSLIIKSADIVEAYYDEISSRLEGKYVATSEYGTYTKETTQTINDNSEGTTREFTNIQQITSKLEGVADEFIKSQAYVHTGLLYYIGANGEETDHEEGTAVYGVEIRQVDTDENGEEVFNKFARFTADRLSFYDQNGQEVAYISDYKLHITHVEITGSISHGGFVTDVSDGIAIRWEGVI